MKQVNLSDFDFSQPVVARKYKGRDAIADVCVSICIKGKNRKNNNSSILLSSFFKRIGADFKNIIFGTNKFNKKEVNTIAVFDSDHPQAASIGHNQKGGIWWASSRGLVQKIFNSFGIQVPDVAGTSARFYFNLEKIEGQPKYYVVVPIILERIDAFGGVQRVDLQNLRGSNRLRQSEPESTIQA